MLKNNIYLCRGNLAVLSGTASEFPIRTLADFKLERLIEFRMEK